MTSHLGFRRSTPRPSMLTNLCLQNHDYGLSINQGHAPFSMNAGEPTTRYGRTHWVWERNNRLKFIKASGNLRPVYHHEPWSWTMEDGYVPWSDSLNNQSTKPLGPSLGVYRMGTERNDHAPNNECDELFLLIYAQKSSLTILLSSSSLSKKNYHFKFLFNISLPWTPVFFYESTSFASPTAKPFGPCQRIM